MAGSIDGPSPNVPKPWLSQTTVWFVLSLAIALLYRLPAVYTAFAGEYTVQDDARQHVFWMQRFVDPDLFPNDLFADYFQSVAPWGYALLYRLGAALGLDPWTFNKILPILIALVTTAFAFGVVIELVQVPVAAFVSALFLNQSLITRDDIVSGTPVAFIYPFFCAFLYCVVQRLWLLSAMLIVLLGLFYPQGVLVIGGMLVLMGLGQLRWKENRVYLVGSAAERRVITIGLLAVFCVLLPYAVRDSVYGPVLTLAEARRIYALSPQGWSSFFSESPIEFWLFGQRTGIFPSRWATLDLKVQPQIWLTFAIPVLIVFPGRSRLARALYPRVLILLQVVIASLGCFCLAHMWLFELHLPNRYTEHSLRIVVGIGIGVAIALIMDRCRQITFPKIGKLIFSVGLMVLVIVPILEISLAARAGADVTFQDSQGNYVVGEFPAVYEYLQSQPKATVIASLDREINNIPSFTNRPIFVGGKGYALPYHLGYFEEVTRRSVDLIQAQYSLDADVVRDFLNRNPIALWMVRPEMFTPEWVGHNRWLRQYTDELEILAIAAAVEQPTILEEQMTTCQAADIPPFVFIDADCLRVRL